MECLIGGRPSFKYLQVQSSTSKHLRVKCKSRGLFDGGQCSSTKVTEVDYLGCMFGRKAVFVSTSGTLRAALQERWEVYV